MNRLKAILLLFYFLLFGRLSNMYGELAQTYEKTTKDYVDEITNHQVHKKEANVNSASFERWRSLLQKELREKLNPFIASNSDKLYETAEAEVSHNAKLPQWLEEKLEADVVTLNQQIAQNETVNDDQTSQKNYLVDVLFEKNKLSFLSEQDKSDINNELREVNKDINEGRVANQAKSEYYVLINMLYPQDSLLVPLDRSVSELYTQKLFEKSNLSSKGAILHLENRFYLQRDRSEPIRVERKDGKLITLNDKSRLVASTIPSFVYGSELRKYAIQRLKSKLANFESFNKEIKSASISYQDPKLWAHRAKVLRQYNESIKEAFMDESGNVSFFASEWTISDYLNSSQKRQLINILQTFGESFNPFASEFKDYAGVKPFFRDLLGSDLVTSHKIISSCEIFEDGNFIDPYTKRRYHGKSAIKRAYEIRSELAAHETAIAMHFMVDIANQKVKVIFDALAGDDISEDDLQVVRRLIPNDNVKFNSELCSSISNATGSAASLMLGPGLEILKWLKRQDKGNNTLIPKSWWAKNEDSEGDRNLAFLAGIVDSVYGMIAGVGGAIESIPEIQKNFLFTTCLLMQEELFRNKAFNAISDFIDNLYDIYKGFAYMLVQFVKDEKQKEAFFNELSSLNPEDDQEFQDYTGVTGVVRNPYHVKNKFAKLTIVVQLIVSNLAGTYIINSLDKLSELCVDNDPECYYKIGKSVIDIIDIIVTIAAAVPTGGGTLYAKAGTTLARMTGKMATVLRKIKVNKFFKKIPFSGLSTEANALFDSMNELREAMLAISRSKVDDLRDWMGLGHLMKSDDLVNALKNPLFSKLKSNIDDLDDVLKPKFMEDFADASEDVLKKLQDNNSTGFENWKWMTEENIPKDIRKVPTIFKKTVIRCK